VERRGPAVCNVSDHKEGKDEMTKASIDLQDLRRRIYVKAKAETSWRFWGLSPEAAGLRLDSVE
jgi:RNA-directed DNA polymerase